MTNFHIGRTLAALICSVLLSTACIIGAVGPAVVGGAAMAAGTAA